MMECAASPGICAAASSGRDRRRLTRGKGVKVHRRHGPSTAAPARLRKRQALASASPGPPAAAATGPPAPSVPLTKKRTEPGSHTISIYVGDESGMINRVAGVFARRGYNIESLAVGLNYDKALFTVVVNGSDKIISQIMNQVYKLVNVLFVENVARYQRVERELMLLKLRVESDTARNEMLELTKIFRGQTVDVSDKAFVLQFTGDPGKTMAIQNTMAKFGIIECGRTGRIALTRGAIEHTRNRLQKANYDTSSGVSNELHDPNAMYKVDDLDLDDDLDEIELETEGKPTSSNGESGVAQIDAEGDVYSTRPVLDPRWDHGHSEEMGYEPRTLNLLVQDVPGVLNAVTSVFARRGYNIISLAVGTSEAKGLSRITTVVPGTEASIQKLNTQLLKLVEVTDAQDITHIPYVERELMLVRVKCNSQTRKEIMDIISVFRAHIVDLCLTSMVIEVYGKLDKMAAIQILLEPYGIIEVARTGRLAMTRESGIDSKFLASSAFRNESS